MTMHGRLGVGALVAGAVAFLSLTGAPASAGETVQLSGKQKAGSVNEGARVESEDVTLESQGTIVKVSGTAKEFCIWKRPGSRAFMCGDHKKRDLVGKTLPAGKYIVIPALDGQRSTEVTVTIEVE